jgi:hypothetical protein
MGLAAPQMRKSGLALVKNQVDPHEANKIKFFSQQGPPKLKIMKNDQKRPAEKENLWLLWMKKGPRSGG